MPVNPQYEKNQELEQYLVTLNKALMPSEKKLVEQHAESGQRFPTLLKIGLPRVGGTLLTQWAMSSGAFYIPSNFLSRFYSTPCVGALITELLRNPNYDYKGELSDIRRDFGFSSDIGKTAGVLAPHEFWYFWRSKLHLPETPVSNEEFVEKSDLEYFLRTLDALKGIAQKPVFLKGHLVNFYLPSLARSNANLIYVHLRRDILDVAQSLYYARIKWNGTDKRWFSHRPREFPLISDLSPIYQVVGQAYFIEKTILDSVELLGQRYFCADYKQLCHSPKSLYDDIVHMVLEHSGVEVDLPPYAGPAEFRYSSRPDAKLRSQMAPALEYFRSNFGGID